MNPLRLDFAGDGEARRLAYASLPGSLRFVQASTAVLARRRLAVKLWDDRHRLSLAVDLGRSRDRDSGVLRGCSRRTLRWLPRQPARLLLLSSHLFFVLSRIGLTDALLTFETALAMFALARDPRLASRAGLWTFGIASGAALLTKGIAGLFAPLALAVVLRDFARAAVVAQAGRRSRHQRGGCGSVASLSAHPAYPLVLGRICSYRSGDGRHRQAGPDVPRNRRLGIT